MSKDQLEEIREFIKLKRYDDARKLLIPLSKSGHPTAQKWLAKLNEISPPQNPISREAQIGNYLDSVTQNKVYRQEVDAQEKAQRRRFGCMLRFASFLFFACFLTFVLGPMLLAAGIVSTNPQLNRVTSEIMSFVEEQQGNPVGRTVTRVYSETSGRLLEGMVVSNMDRICDMVIDQVEAQGRTVPRSMCEAIVNEVSVCMTDELVNAEQCLRDYVHNRCIQQTGNTPEGQAFCVYYVNEHMGPG